jgi:hypothetical protein
MKLLAWVLARQTRAECGDDESGKTWNAVAWAENTVRCSLHTYISQTSEHGEQASDKKTQERG